MGGFFRDVLEGRVRDVKKWVEGGQKVGLYDEYGNTALHMAAEKGFRGVCKVLLDGGADVNQRNESVGWTAVHYASYEGHADVLRMLIAHGALADIADKAGDTAESYAREWDNEECLRILQESLGKERQTSRLAQGNNSGADSLCDSRDSNTPSDDSDEEDEDESSMMNWVIPPVASNMPPPKVENMNIENKLKNNLGCSKQLGGAMEDLRTGGSQAKVDNREEEDVSIGSCVSSNYQSVHLALPGARKVVEARRNGDGGSDTESEDTLNLMKEVEKTKCKARPSSIVDRMIKSSLSPAPSCQEDSPTPTPGPAPVPDIDRLLDERSIQQQLLARGRRPTGEDAVVVRTIEEAEIKIACEKVRREKSASRARSQSREVAGGERRRSVARAVEQAREVVGQERGRKVSRLPPRLAVEQLLSMSSATIPDNMTMSCTSVLDRLGEDGVETEKELLLRRLRELMEGENRQVQTDLEARRRQLVELEDGRREQVERLQEAHRREEQEVLVRQAEERRAREERHLQEEERIGREISKLQEELERLKAPSELLSSLTTTQPASPTPAKAELSELEQELQCCSCSTVCAPPTQIFQCPEGDLLCGSCRGGGQLSSCPSCKLELAGQTSRNKVLENIARKYFRDKGK